jgi:hypothetical protein
MPTGSTWIIVGAEAQKFNVRIMQGVEQTLVGS